MTSTTKPSSTKPPQKHKPHHSHPKRPPPAPIPTKPSVPRVSDVERSLHPQLWSDEDFFAQKLDWIPRKFLIPLTDEEKDDKHAKFLQNKSAAGKDSNAPKALKENRFSNAVSNSDSLEAASVRAQAREREMHSQVLANEVLAVPEETERAKSFAELRERLQAKIDQQRKRGGFPGARAERDKLLPPKAERKRTPQDEVGSVASSSIAGTLSSMEEDEPTRVLSAPSSEGLRAKISYGALRLDRQDDNPTKKDGLSTKSIINVKKLLKRAEAGQARIDELKSQGQTEKVHDEKWAAIEKKAAGEKVRDDPKLLRKALKRLEKKKAHSAAEWKERKTKVEEGKNERLDARDKNISDRKSKKTEKRKRPGFEGAKQLSPTPTSQGTSSKKTKPSGKQDD